jgi:outer membrane murein-binding lipoprotein Lpp
MRNLRILVVMVISAIIWSCGGSSNNENKKEQKNSELSEMQERVKQMAEQAEKIQAEKENESEEDKKIWSQKNIDLFGFNVEGRKISDSTWQRAIVLANKYKSLEKEQLRALTHESINQMILDAGFTDLEVAKAEMQKIADSRDFIISLLMNYGSLESTRMIDGEEAYKTEAKEIGQKVNERGYSPEDLEFMDQNSNISVSIIELLWRLNN